MDEARLRELLERNGLSKYSDGIIGFEMNSIRLRTEPVEDESLLPVGASKLGGTPDLPPRFEWPQYTHDRARHIEMEQMAKGHIEGRSKSKQGLLTRVMTWLSGSSSHADEVKPQETQDITIVTSPLSFIAQINLSDAAAYDTDHLLPSNGMLYFFYDAIDQPGGYGPEDANGNRVIYCNVRPSELKRTQFPAELDEEGVFAARTVQFSNERVMPEWGSVFLDGLGMSMDDQHVYSKLMTEFLDLDKSPIVRHRMLGHPDAQQADVFLDAERCAGETSYDDPLLDKMSQEWTLLLQADSTEDSRSDGGWMWGDVGMIYFCMRKQDLQARDFSKVWLVHQCG